MELTSRRGFVATAAGVALAGLAGCIGGVTSQGADGHEGRGTGDDAQSTARGPRKQGVPIRSSPLPVEYEFSTLREEVLSGGPPKDGIPSIDDPKFRSAENADEDLRDADVVFGLVRNGEAKAYPQKILVHHEITNDAVGGEPVAVTYCPLTGTAMGFRRGETTFGVSGKLLNNNLVMYDRETDSRWPQVLGTAISGAFEGESLREFRLVWTTWKRWKQAHPETRVLSEETGYVRNYGQDPYGSYVPNPSGYYVRDSTLFPPLRSDGRLPNKRVVAGARTGAGRIAFDKSALREAGLLSGSVGDTPHLAVYDAELDAAYVYRNPDGASFDYEDGRAVAGDGTRHDPADLPLLGVYAFDAMWFAWAGFYPSTGLVTGEGESG
ncbi:DUF3179 domain-containing protein [Halorussus caseinilyticus]|uniref:DUF3179 domain-containing protein n=1 Tax=Halorussus caseinilyticus TaxID=3034025 RepID=A0ABD5WRT2_9EURY|nr:DUF3179 domain-containing protein [Halorussus sp. DT72]